MIKTLKRYKSSILLLAVAVFIYIISPEKGIKIFTITKSNIKEMISVIPPIFVLLGLLDVWVDRSTMIRFTGKGSGIKGMLISFLLGSAAAGPLYASFPVAALMIKKGSSLFNVLIFVGAWSTTKIPLLTFEAASMGIKFMSVRLILSIMGIFIIAYVTDKLLTNDQKNEIIALNSNINE
ncbi:permease [Proteocatella sphenisci]|uniref:permease n=1 Tax=Proteocatella sphenisci TaxID=181070 RepID=UPI00048B0DB8|nr:permease [Proteocatella sphenisci]